MAARRSARSAHAPPFQLVDVTAAAGLPFRHNSGAYGGKLLPETLGSGCAFLDYDADGWQDILLVNGMDWPGHKRQRSTLRLYRNNRNGTFTDVTRAAGLDVEMYGMGVAVGDFNNDGFPDICSSRASARTGCSATPARARSSTSRARAASADGSAFSTSALWVDFDRDGLLDLFVCNYVKWSAEHDVFCSLDGKQKSYCTPEAYRGDTCWLFRNRGDGTFEDVTATSGIFDSSSKSLGVAMLDYDQDGWPDLFVANDTQPNKLYRNLRNGTFTDVAVEAGVAFSDDGKARAGMGVDAGDFDNSGAPTAGGHQLRQRDDRPVSPLGHGLVSQDVARAGGRRRCRRATRSASAASSPISISTARSIWWSPTATSTRPCATSAATSATRSRRSSFSIRATATFRDVAAPAGADFAQPKVGRGLACGDFDRDGDVDLLMTTNNGPASCFATTSRPAIAACASVSSARSRIATPSARPSASSTAARRSRGMVKSGSSYLSQSELPVTFGVGRRDRVERVVITWPSGRTEEFKNVATGRAYECVEGKGLS